MVREGEPGERAVSFARVSKWRDDRKEDVEQMCEASLNPWLVKMRQFFQSPRGSEIAMSPDDKFDQVQYWSERHERLRGDPRSVGHLGRSIEENLTGEESLKVQIRKILPLVGGTSVLDLGCGYGRVANDFIAMGYHYTGVDVSPSALEQARERVPAANFILADLNKWDTKQRFDVVSVLYVFVHFVKDADWESIVTRALSWTRPGGAMLLADELQKEKKQPASHLVIRRPEDYEELISKHGFHLDQDFRNKVKDWAPHFYLARRR